MQFGCISKLSLLSTQCFFSLGEWFGWKQKESKGSRETCCRWAPCGTDGRQRQNYYTSSPRVCPLSPPGGGPWLAARTDFHTSLLVLPLLVAKCVLMQMNAPEKLCSATFSHLPCFRLFFSHVCQKYQVDFHFATIYMLFKNETKPLSILPMQCQALQALIHSL